MPQGKSPVLAAAATPLATAPPAALATCSSGSQQRGRSERAQPAESGDKGRRSSGDGSVSRVADGAGEAAAAGAKPADSPRPVDNGPAEGPAEATARQSSPEPAPPVPSTVAVDPASAAEPAALVAADVTKPEAPAPKPPLSKEQARAEMLERKRCMRGPGVLVDWLFLWRCEHSGNHTGPEGQPMVYQSLAPVGGVPDSNCQSRVGCEGQK